MIDVNSIPTIDETEGAPKLYPIVRTCAECGTEFTISPADQKFLKFKGYELPKRCEACRMQKYNLNTFTCVDCNNEFVLTNSEIFFFRSKNLQTPKRCPECLKFKREKQKRFDAYD